MLIFFFISANTIKVFTRKRCLVAWFWHLFSPDADIIIVFTTHTFIFFFLCLRIHLFEHGKVLKYDYLLIQLNCFVLKRTFSIIREKYMKSRYIYNLNISYLYNRFTLPLEFVWNRSFFHMILILKYQLNA